MHQTNSVRLSARVHHFILQPYAGSFEPRAALGTAMCLPDSLGGKCCPGISMTGSIPERIHCISQTKSMTFFF